MTTQPSCFGKSWDPATVECKGGLDPSYSNPRDQTHRRDQCSWFHACSQQTRAPAPVPPPLIQPRSLLQSRPDPEPPRPAAPAYTPPRPPTYTPQAQLPPAAPHMPAPAQHYSYAAPIQPVQHYQQPPQLYGSQIPQYLSVPEPVDDGPYTHSLGRTILRALCKALGQSFASYIDTNPFRRRQ